MGLPNQSAQIRPTVAAMWFSVMRKLVGRDCLSICLPWCLQAAVLSKHLSSQPGRCSHASPFKWAPLGHAGPSFCSPVFGRASSTDPQPSLSWDAEDRASHQPFYSRQLCGPPAVHIGCPLLKWITEAGRCPSTYRTLVGELKVKAGCTQYLSPAKIISSRLLRCAIPGIQVAPERQRPAQPGAMYTALPPPGSNHARQSLEHLLIRYDLLAVQQ